MAGRKNQDLPAAELFQEKEAPTRKPSSPWLKEKQLIFIATFSRNGGKKI